MIAHMKKPFQGVARALPALLLFLLLSCQQGFVGDPRLYGGRKTTEEASLPSYVDVPTDDTPEDQDPFINGEWNKLDYGGFSGDVFATWVLSKVNFSDDNIPSYQFDTSGKSWTAGDAAYHAYTYDAKNEGNKAQGYSINPMTVYQYRSKNPLVSAASSYNADGGKMDRFYFHRIVGASGGGIAQLDQYLIAIDIRSKFVFAYAKITETKSLLGNNLPTKFAPMENYGSQLPFYKYDPIGYVTQDGKVYLYHRYRQDMLDSAAVNFEPTIHGYTKMASHTGGVYGIKGDEDTENTDGEGYSPYYGTTTGDDAKETFTGNMQDIIGTTYQHREGVYLYTYTIKDKNTIVRTGKKYQSSEEVPEKTFTLSEVFSGITAYFTTEEDGATVTYTVDLKDKETQITFKEENEDETAPDDEKILREFTAYRNFKDSGPGFVLRVAGKTFQYTSESKYAGKLMKFSEDGMTLYDESEGDTFTLSSEGSETQAKYKSGSTYYPLELSEGDSLIKWGTGFIFESWVSYGTCKSNPARLLQSDMGSFHENVSGRVYQTREGLLLYTLSFTDGGKTATVKTEEWRTNKSATVETLTLKEDGTETSASATYGDKTFTITNLNEMTPLVVSDGTKTRTYDLHFEDPEPEFLLRLQNDVSFANDDDDTYTFSNGGKTLVMNGDTYTYVRQGSPNNRAVYKKENTSQLLKYYGVELSEGDDGTKDDKVTMTSRSAENSILWNSLGWEAYRGFEVTDSFADNVKGAVYLARDGLNLRTYTFSADGRSVDVTSTVWRVNTTTTDGTLKWQSQTDGSNASYAEEKADGAADAKAFTISDAGKYLTVGDLKLERQDTFSDPGPEFLLRVAGATYDDGKDESRYVFSEDGKTLTLTYKNWLGSKKTNTYTFDKADSDDYTKATYGGYGVRLTDNDGTIEMATTPGGIIYEYEAYRQN